MSKQHIFSDFPPVSRQQWVEKAVQDLKGADFTKKLVWNTYEGFSVQPFYTAEDIQSIAEFTAFAQTVQRPESAWINYSEIPAGSSSVTKALAERSVQQGADGLLFIVNGSTGFKFEEVLSQIDLTALHVSFRLPTPDPEFVKSYLGYIGKRGGLMQFMDLLIVMYWNSGLPEKKSHPYL